MARRDSIGAGIRVLLLDDSLSALDFQRMLLERYGFEVRSCSCLAELTEVEADWQPDVVVSDVDLPDACEVDVLSTVADHHVTRRARVVLCSGLPLDDLERLGRDRGVAGVVSKSDNIRELPETLRRIMSSAQGDHDGKSTTRQ